MSLEGDTADKLVHEGIEVTEAALKLAGLGAKNLAALLLALLKDNEKLKGKTSMNTLLRQDRQLSVFHVKKEDMGKFKELAGRYGVLFAATYHKHQDKGICDVLVKADDAARVNRILEKLEYPSPAKEADAKNAAARAPQNGRSKGRGPGWIPRPMGDPVKKYTKKTGPLESLGAETLAAMVLKVAGENREQGHADPLAELLAGKDLRILPVRDMDVAVLQKNAARLDVPLTFLPGHETGQHHMLARESDAPIIGWLFEQTGYPPPAWPKDASVKAKQEKSAAKPAVEKPSVKTKVEQAKGAAKAAPVRARPHPSRAARPAR